MTVKNQNNNKEEGKTKPYFAIKIQSLEKENSSKQNGTIRIAKMLADQKKLQYLCSVNHRYHLEIDAAKRLWWEL